MTILKKILELILALFIRSKIKEKDIENKTPAEELLEKLEKIDHSPLDQLVKEDTNKMDVLIAIKIIDLVAEVGIPAAIEIFKTWKRDTPVTAEEIEKYILKTKDPESYFK